MSRGFVVVLAAVAACAFAGQASAGEGLSGFSVDADPPKAAAEAATVGQTPQGVECPLGIAQVTALEGSRSEYGGTPYKVGDLAKALRKANKPKTFDCVVIEGGKPASVDAMARVIKALGAAPVKHVEWGGALPEDTHKPTK